MSRLGVRHGSVRENRGESKATLTSEATPESDFQPTRAMFKILALPKRRCAGILKHPGRSRCRPPALIDGRLNAFSQRKSNRMHLVRMMTSWILGLIMLGLRMTCRVKVYNDPRQRLRAAKQPYVYSILHAQQVAAAINREKNTAAMVSRSGDGQLLMAGFWLLRIKAIRGSSNSSQSSKGTQRGKGGRQALTELTSHVQSGAPAILAVDGPRGPRNRVRKGIAALSQKTGAGVLNVVLIPSRRWILRRTWDRLQIPQPFCRIDAYFAEPLWPGEGENVETYRRRIEASLNALEAEHDPDETRIAQTPKQSQ